MQFACLEAFNQRHGRYPPSLQQLVPTYAPQMPPRGSFPGTTWTYTPNADCSAFTLRWTLGTTFDEFDSAEKRMYYGTVGQPRKPVN